MSEQPSFKIDLSYQKEVLQILPAPPILSSETSDWGNVNLQVYGETPAWETPSHCAVQHFLVVHNTSFSNQERKLDGKRSSGQIMKGDIVIVPANTEHWTAWQKPITDFLVMSIAPEYLAKIAQESINPDRIELLPRFPQPDTLIYGLGLTLKQELESGRGDLIYLESLSQALAMHLLKKCCTRQPKLQEYIDGLPPYLLKQARDYIQAYLNHKLKLEDIAEMLGMSQYYFSHLFSRSMGIAPYQYVIQQRVEKAKQLLRQQRDLSIADIALECGFSHQSHLAKYFKQLTSVTFLMYSKELS